MTPPRKLPRSLSLLQASEQTSGLSQRDCEGRAMPPPPLQTEEPGAIQGPQLPTATWPASRGAEPETQV